MPLSYQWDARDYEKNSAGQLEWARELIDKLCLEGHESLIDLGCGDGKVAILLSERLPEGHVTGIDNSRNMIDLAVSKYPDHPRLSFRHLDVRDLDYDAEFQVAFSNAALHWVRDHRPMLKGVARALAPGGRILFQMGGSGNAGRVIEIFDRLAAKGRWAPYFRDFEFPYGFYGPDDYRIWMPQAGLEPTRIDLIPKDMKHQGAEGLAGWIRTTWLPYLDRVPTGDREALVGELVEAYLKQYPADAEGLVHVDMVRLEVEAVKPL